jgi:hypothetical protein
MGLKCKIGRNYKGMPIGLDSSGQESLLFLEARNELYEDGLSEIQANNKAFEIWATASSEEFQELTGKNEDTATYADYKAFARTLTKPAELNEREQYELSEVMRSYGYESLSEFKRQLDRIFRAEGKYSIETSEALISGLYTLQSLNDVDVSKVISLMNKIDRQLELGNDIFVEPFESYAVYQGDSFASPTLGIVKKQTLKDIEDIIKERAQSFTEEEIRAAVRELDNTEFIRKFEGNETFAKEFIDGFKGLRKIPVQTIGLEGLEPVSKRKTTIRNTFPASVNLTPITARADYFRNIPEAVWNNSQEEIEKLLSKTEEIAAEQGIDIIGLRGLQKQEVVEVLDAIAEAVETKNPDALATVLDNLLPEPAYTKIQRFDENFTPQTLINVDTNLSNEELFNSYGLIPLGNNVYQKVDTNESMQDLYEALADMVSENQIVIPEVHQTGDVLSDLERWLKTRDTGYGYKNPMASAFQLLFEHPVPEPQDTSSVSEVLDTDYLTQRFPLDFYKAILKQKLAGINVYDKAFTITSRDITLDDQTVPTEGIPLMEQLVEYATISKNPEIRMFARTADESDPVIDAINNKDQVKEFANDFVGRGDQIVTAKNSAPVIKVNDILYAKGRDLGDISVYNLIEYQEDNTHYTTKYSVSPQEISLQELSDISARLLETDQGPNDSINKSGLASPFMQHLKETAKRIRETPRETVSLQEEQQVRNLTDNQIQDEKSNILAGKSIFKRFSQAEHTGLIAGGEHHVAATLLTFRLRDSGQEDPTEWESQAEKVLERYAKDNNIWVDLKPLGEPQAIGAEAAVWFNPEKNTVTKAISHELQGGLDLFLDRITVHNTLFPATKMEVKGFARDPYGIFNIVIEQPLVIGEQTTISSIQEYMSKLGLEKDGDFKPAEIEYTNKDYILTDLHLGNVLRTPQGNLAVIDGSVAINFQTTGYGGTRVENNSIQSLGEQDTPRFMILGERGAQALDQAEESTRRLDNLAVARKMEEAGRTPLEIRVATEWERGADGLFRYEVGDLILKEELPQEGQEEDLIVADFIGGGDLIEAFPEILDITIRIVDYNEVEYEAMYSRQEDTIFLANYLIDEDARGMLLRKLSHELQHVVQEKEGFTIEGRKEIEEATPMGKLNLKSPYSDIKDGSFDLVTDLFEDFEREGYKLATDPPLIEGTNYYKILKSFAKDVANRLSKPIEEVRVLDRNTFEVTGFQRAYNYLRQDDELEVPATKEGIIESLDSDTEDFKVRNAVQGKTLQEIKEDFEKEQDEDRKYDLEKVIEILETREGIKKQVQNGGYKASGKVSSTATISNFLRNLPGDFPLESVYNYIVDLNEESEDTARNTYTVAASEVEARNVEERTEMSPQERRNTLLQETEDVAREDQIVLLEGFSAQSIQTQQESIGSPILQQLINQLSKLNTATKTSIVSPQQLSLYLKERGISDKVAEQVTNKEQDPAVSTILEAKGLRLTPQGLYNPTTREILINQEAVDPINTTIHEFAHSFFHVVREKRRDVYEAGLSLVTKNQKEAQPYIDLVKATQPNLVEGTQEFLEEILTQIIGDNGSRLVKQNTKGSIKTWLQDLWTAVKEIFGLSTYTAEQVSNMTIQQFSDAVLKDMFSGQDINELFTGPQGEDNFNKWKGSNTLFEKGEIQNIRTGDPVVVKVYHGTTNEFYEFDSRVKGNIEGHLGKVNYFTSDYQDASNNYLSEGADITGRIDRRQDELEDTLRYEYQDSDEGLDFQQIIDDFNITDSEVEDLYPSGKPTFIQAEEISRFLAERELKGDTEKVLELYVKLNNPVVIGNGNSYVDLTDRGQFEEYIKDAVQEIADEYGISTEEAKEDYSWDIDNRAMEMAGYENPLYQALEQAISDNTYDYDNAPEKVSKILSDFYESEVNLSQLETRIREELSYEQNEEGEITSSQIVADFFQNLGFDGVILTDVSRRFRNMGLGGNTSHIHVFDEYSNQIKLADGSNVTFGTTKDIRFSVQPQAPLDVTSNQFIHDANFELLIEPDGRLQDKYDACG